MKGKIASRQDRTIISCRTGVGHGTALFVLTALTAWLVLFGFLGANHLLKGLEFLQVICAVWVGSVGLRLFAARDHRRSLLHLLTTTLETRVSTLEGRVGTDRQVSARQVFASLPGHHYPLSERLVQVVAALLIVGFLSIIALTVSKELFG